MLFPLLKMGVGPWMAGAAAVKASSLVLGIPGKLPPSGLLCISCGMLRGSIVRYARLSGAECVSVLLGCLGCRGVLL